MPAADALTLHTALREQCDNPRFQAYLEEHARATAKESHITDADWETGMSVTAFTNAVKIAETFYISPNMHEVVKLAAQDFPRDETVMREDQPSDVGVLYLPVPLAISDPRVHDGPRIHADTQMVHGMMWFNNRIWLIGDLLDPDDWMHRQVIEKGGDPAVAASAMGRWQLCGYTVFKYNEALPEVMHRETIKLSDGIEFPIPRFERAETITYLLAAWRLMQQSLSTVTREVSSIPRGLRRRSERMHLPKSVTVIELRRQEGTQGEGTGYKINYRTPVRGHWRRVWCGPMSEPENRYRRAVYIHPTIRGPEGAPLIIRERVQALMR